MTMNGTQDEMNKTAPATVYAPAPQPQASQPASAVTTSTAAPPDRKSPLLACLLSAMPGLGQIYVGYYQRGFVHAIVVAALIFILSSGVSGMEPLLGPFLAFFWLYNVIDAGRRAAHYNRAAAGEQAFEMPKDFEMPGMQGSILGGLLLIAAGAIFLSHTVWGISLAWIEDWWPLAPILFGVYLIGKAVVDRATKEER
jgi:TM2 domain-containing membrane protein YozV